MRKILRCILWMALFIFPGWALQIQAGPDYTYVEFVIYENPFLGYSGMFLITLGWFIPLVFYGGLEPEPDPLEGLYQMEVE